MSHPTRARLLRIHHPSFIPKQGLYKALVLIQICKRQLYEPTVPSMYMVETQQSRIDPNLRRRQGRSRSGNGLTGHKATESSNNLLIGIQFSLYSGGAPTLCGLSRCKAAHFFKLNHHSCRTLPGATWNLWVNWRHQCPSSVPCFASWCMLSAFSQPSTTQRNPDSSLHYSGCIRSYVGP